MEIFMKKTGSVPKLKNFFASEPSCVVHGAGKQCVTGKAPSFSKKAEAVFNKIAMTSIKDLKAAEAALKNIRKFIKASTDEKALTMYMKKEKAVLNKVNRFKSEIKN
jgi:hypothetical protein